MSDLIFFYSRSDNRALRKCSNKIEQNYSSVVSRSFQGRDPRGRHSGRGSTGGGAEAGRHPGEDAQPEGQERSHPPDHPHGHQQAKTTREDIPRPRRPR